MKIIVLLINTLIVSISFGQIIDPFTIRFQTNQKGNIRMLSNVSVGCSCPANNEIPPGGTEDNNWLNSTLVDIDNDASTFTSSSDQLNLANCSEITWAGLYWSAKLNDPATTTPNYSIRNQVKLSINAGPYIDLTADEILDNTIGKVSYYAFKDITSILQSNTTNSNYTIANIVTGTGVDVFGGWTIVVVYRDQNESMRNLSVFDGLANVKANTSSLVDIPLSGFFTPPTGPVTFEIGVVAHDGDRAQSGDQLQFNGAGSFVNISDPIHNVNNVFNSTISNGGILTPFRNPNYNNTLGYDATIFKPNNGSFNYIGNSASTATIRVFTNSETVLTSVITSAIDLYEPELVTSLTYNDLNGGTIVPGDILEFSILSKNIGSDNSINTFLVDTLDQRLIYLPGTIEISYGPNSGIKTDNIDSDQAEFIVADNVIKARIGIGANDSSGGILLNSPTGIDSTVITFKVRVNDDCPVWQCGNDLHNRVHIFGTGQTSGYSSSNNGLSYELNSNGCLSLESSIVAIDFSSCADLIIHYTDSLCVNDTLEFNFVNSQFLDYSWSGPNGFTSTTYNPTIPNVQLINSGLYTLQVTYSGNNCLSDSSVNVFVSAPPSIVPIHIINVNCYNSSTGLIEISAVGNPGFTYYWSNNDLDSIIDGISAGSYSVTVTDRYGCSIKDTFSITEPQDITLTETSIDPSCQGGTQGSIDLTVSGGTPGYTYSWNNNSTSQDISGLYAGQYIVFVTDSNGCKDTLVIQLNDPDALILSEIHEDVLCYGDSTGTIDLSVSSGIPDYTYDWSNGQVTEDAIGLPFGNYYVNVIDQNNCGAFISIFITQPDSKLFFTSENTTDVKCFGESNGSIDLEIVGGVTPYSFLWSNGTTSLDLMNIPIGNYLLTVTDANGCILTDSYNINQPDPLISFEEHINVQCLGDTTGSIKITTAGGTAPYTYDWNTGNNSADLTGLPIGNYVLTTKDSNNCLHTLLIKIEPLLASFECVKIEMPNIFTPNNDLSNDFFIPVELSNIKSYNLKIVSRWGELMFESEDPIIGWDGTFKNKQASEGVYFYIVNYIDEYNGAGKLQGHLTLIR